VADSHVITPEQSDVLIAVWQLQQLPETRQNRALKGRAIPVKEIATFVGKTVSATRQIAKRLEKSGFLTNLPTTDRHGLSLVAYAITDGKTVRIPETAFVLRELRQEDVDPERPQQILLKPFEDRMRKRGLSERWIRNHLEYLIKKRFIIPYPLERPTHVWLSNRTIAESHYLESLADKYTLSPARR